MAKKVTALIKLQVNAGISYLGVVRNTELDTLEIA